MKNAKLIKQLEESKITQFRGYCPAILLSVREVNIILKALKND